MEALIGYIEKNGLRSCLRHNVSDVPVNSVTLGIVDKRSSGFGLSSATCDGKFELLRLAHAVVSSSPCADKPEMYTSICINWKVCGD